MQEELTPLRAMQCINPIPTADFDASHLNACPGQQIQFNDQSIGRNIASWQWTFPGGSPSSSTLQNPTVSYASNGVYSVTLTVTNANGSNTETKTGYITVAPPTATLSGNSTIIQGNQAFLSVVFTGGRSIGILPTPMAQMTNSISGITNNPFFLSGFSIRHYELSIDCGQ